jgi:hypothetical protein
MRQPALLRTFQMSVLTSALALGCSHADKQGCTSCGGHAVAPPHTIMASQPAASPYMSFPAPTVTQAQVVAPAQPAKEIVTVGYALHGGHDRDVKRRSFADITANPCFAHAADYSSLTGELRFLHTRGAWTLRYASVDEEDRFGGSVTLQEHGPMSEFKSGQFVRVDGRMVDDESREPSPIFRVRNIQVVDKQ